MGQKGVDLSKIMGKNIFKKWWFWTIVVIMWIFVYGLSFTAPENNKADVAGLLPIAEEIKPAETEPVEAKPVETKAPEAEAKVYSVVKVVDGDTFSADINGKTETLRLIGIDTPEVVDPRKPVQCFGVEASNKAKELLTGKKVILQADPAQGERDKYNRLLRYAWLEDGTFFNLKMIEEGYAFEYTYDTAYKYQAEFKQAEEGARLAKRGLWADNACREETQAVAPVVPVAPAQSASTGSSINCQSNVYNCTDFKTQAEAQKVFDACGGASNDIHKLDADKDGTPCESLP